jgi:hypothetical protein
MLNNDKADAHIRSLRANRKRKRILVSMIQVGEHKITPDGQSLVHVRLPWFRADDGCWAISVGDIVSDPHPS